MHLTLLNVDFFLTLQHTQIVQTIRFALLRLFKVICNGKNEIFENSMHFEVLIFCTFFSLFFMFRFQFLQSNRFGQDCNEDGAINCLDHAAIHYRGGYGCKGDLPEKYRTVFDSCIRQFL